MRTNIMKTGLKTVFGVIILSPLESRLIRSLRRPNQCNRLLAPRYTPTLVRLEMTNP